MGGEMNDKETQEWMNAPMGRYTQGDDLLAKALKSIDAKNLIIEGLEKEVKALNKKIRRLLPPDPLQYFIESEAE